MLLGSRGQLDVGVDGATAGRNDTGCDGGIQRKRVPNGKYPLTELNFVGVALNQVGQVAPSIFSTAMSLLGSRPIRRAL